MQLNINNSYSSILSSKLIRSLESYNACYILCFHRLVKDGVSLEPALRENVYAAGAFEELVGKFREEFEIISLDQLVDSFENNRKINKSVVLTFDDGYRDLFTILNDLVDKNKIPVTIFPAIDFIEQKNFSWWYYARFIVWDDQTRTLDLSVLKKDLIFKNNNEKSRQKNWKAIRSILLKMNCVEQKEFLSSLWTSPQFIEPYETLSWEELKVLSKNKNISIGSHGISHQNLKVMSLEDAEKEISQSKSLLERELNLKVDTFCYPYGDPSCFGLREIELVRKYYKAAVTTNYGSIQALSKKSDPLYSLPRITVSYDDDYCSLLGKMSFKNLFLRKLLKSSS